MAESLFSSSWYRVAGVTPRLRGHATVHRHVYRDQVWYVLQDRSNGRYHRFSPNANLIIGLMNGTRTVREIWNTACTRLGDDAPTQDEVIHLLAALHRADVLQTNAPPDIEELHERNVQQKRMKLRQYIQNPLALRFPLLDPDAFLDFINPITSKLFGWAGALAWLVVVGWALLLVGTHWNELTKDVTDRLLSAQNLLLVSLVFPVVKIIHEFGHAAATKARGGEVHEMGVMFLVLMPVPYVDASASLAFRSKRDRIVVGASGMVVELFLAALAMIVWVNVEPGLVRGIAYNVIIVAGISTIIFNANPLLRFDGYYILSDMLEIPNLGQRANAYVGHLTSRYLLGAKSSVAKESSPGERVWFVFYAVTSFIYRMFITIAIAIAVAERYFFFGVMLAVWSLYSVLVLPVGKKIAYLYSNSELRGSRAQAITVVALIGAFVTAIVIWYPAPSWTRTEAVTIAPLNAHVRAPGDGFITSVQAAPNSRVRNGEPLVVIEDPELTARVKVLEAQLKEQEARYAAAREDRVQSNIIKDEIGHIRARLEHTRKRAQELVLRSSRDGVFIMSQVEDAPGRFVRRGELLAYVMDFSEIAIQAVIPQDEIDLVRKMTRRVELRLVERIPEIVPAVVKRVVPAATDQLPNLALSAQGGGEVPLDPGGSTDASRSAESKAAMTMFIFELEIGTPDRLKSLGSRIYARFEREPEPLGTQWYRTFRRVLLKKFNV
jgi:putative peptide zinc metalloprotease protein